MDLCIDIDELARKARRSILLLRILGFLDSVVFTILIHLRGPALAADLPEVAFTAPLPMLSTSPPILKREYTHLHHCIRMSFVLLQLPVASSFAILSMIGPRRLLIVQGQSPSLDRSAHEWIHIKTF